MQQICILFKFVAAKPGHCIQALALHKYYLAGPHTYLPYLCVSQPEKSIVFSMPALLSSTKLLLFQVKSSLGADNELSLDDCTAGCTMVVPPDGMVFMVLLVDPAAADGRILYNLVT